MSGYSPVEIFRANLNSTDRPARKAKREETSFDAEAETFAKTEALNRRHFMSDVAKAAGGTCVSTLLLSLYAKLAESKPAHALRPPGALEEEFLSARVRRGLCVRACPSSPSQVCAAGFLRT